jgi:hypothetical protein
MPKIFSYFSNSNIGYFILIIWKYFFMNLKFFIIFGSVFERDLAETAIQIQRELAI